MDSSDDENEQLHKFVENYYFCNDDGEPISFSTLPLSWTTNEITDSRKKPIDLHGTTDGGLQRFFKRVKAWKFDITREEPEISVLSTENYWIRIEKPRKSYQEIISSVLITVNFLHLVKKDPEMSKKAVWSKLSQIFRLYEERPSVDDLQHHKGLIKEAVKHDESLKKSEYLVMILEDKPQKVDSDEDTSTKSKKDFIVKDGEEEDEDVSGEEDGADDEDEPFDSVCCICDNGGDLLCCDGVCMRSFHATLEAAEEAESSCASLGLTREEVKEIPIFMCRNCQYKQHQCYSCGQLGSSDKSSGAEVFQCVNATCGYFYHPYCVAKLLHRGNEVAAKELQDKILAGESFACPLHVCITCKQPEDKTISELQMAVCRRCPKAYHRKCLPKKIAMEDNEDEDITQRAWTDLLVDRILIYCLKHEIDEDLGTPARNHIKFPGDSNNKKQSSGSVLAKKVPMLTKDFPSQKKKKPLAVEVAHTVSGVQSKKNNALVGQRTDIKSSKPKLYNTLKKTSTEKKHAMTKKMAKSATEPKVSLGDALYAVYTQSDLQKPTKPEKRDEDELTKTRKPVLKVSEPQLDSDSEKRILDIMKEASSIITMDDIILKHEKSIPSRAYKNKMDLKGITQGKVEGFCKAVRVASKKLEETGNIEDAKSILNPNVLNQVVKWKNKLSVYLSPFLYGMRYTSYGRHFTKIDKLKEIVDKIHWYVNNGDTIVDFCCGSNDFSLLMKQKLEQFGKKCSFKNFDLFRPKNDFCFEKRDWLEAKPSNLQLPTGSQLIMGLNPPFGVKAALANKFIDKALEFKPKLLILIVPSETERLDTKKTPYELIWEDYDKLSGKSFYLPGSVDVNDQQLEDWNNVPPVLYLWSRTDWTQKHKSIAEKHGHLSSETSRLVQDSPVINKDQDNDAVMEHGGSPEDVLADVLTEKVVGGAADTLGKPSARNDHEGEKQQSSLGDTLGKGSARNDHEGEKRQSSVGDTLGKRSAARNDQEGGKQQSSVGDTLGKRSARNDHEGEKQQSNVGDTLGKRSSRNDHEGEKQRSGVGDTLGKRSARNDHEGEKQQSGVGDTLGKGSARNDHEGEKQQSNVGDTLGKRSSRNEHEGEKQRSSVGDTLGKRSARNDHEGEKQQSSVCDALGKRSARNDHEGETQQNSVGDTLGKRSARNDREGEKQQRSVGDTLGKRSARNDRKGEKQQSSVGDRGKKKRKQHEEKKQRSIDSEAKQKWSYPSSPHHVNRSLSSASKPHESGPHHSPDPIVERRRSEEHLSMDPKTASDMEVDDASRDPLVERPIHYTTNYDASRYGRAPSFDAPPEVDYYREPPQPSSSDVGVYGRTRDGYHGSSSYSERVSPYPAPDPFSTSRERWRPMDDATRSGGVEMGYNREVVDYGYNHPPPLSNNADLRYRPPSYSMGSTYNRMNSMPVSERYALRLDDPHAPRMGEHNPLMPRDVGGGMFNYRGPRPGQAHNHHHMGFAPGPVNYYPPHSGPRGGWLHE